MKILKTFCTLIPALALAQLQGLGINNSQPKGVLDLSTEDGTNSTLALVLPRVNNVRSVAYLHGGSIANGTLVYDKEDNCPKVYLGNIQTWSPCISGGNTVYSESEVAINNDCFVFNNINYCVIQASNGRYWLNKDLETSAYYQWGRGNDGHQKPSSAIINLNTKPIPFSGTSLTEFIINYNAEKNWVNSSFTNHSQLWNPLASPNNNPCPSGWKVPLESEISALSASDINMLFGSAMDNKGVRQADKEGTYNYGGYFIWSSTLDGTDMSKAAKISSGSVTMVSQRRDAGLRVRCIKQ